MNNIQLNYDKADMTLSAYSLHEAINKNLQC